MHLFDNMMVMVIVVPIIDKKCEKGMKMVYTAADDRDHRKAAAATTRNVPTPRAERDAFVL